MDSVGTEQLWQLWYPPSPVSIFFLLDFEEKRLVPEESAKPYKMLLYLARLLLLYLEIFMAEFASILVVRVFRRKLRRFVS